MYTRRYVRAGRGQASSLLYIRTRPPFACTLSDAIYVCNARWHGLVGGRTSRGAVRLQATVEARYLSVGWLTARQSGRTVHTYRCETIAAMLQISIADWERRSQGRSDVPAQPRPTTHVCLSVFVCIDRPSREGVPSWARDYVSQVEVMWSLCFPPERLVGRDRVGTQCTAV